MPGGLFCAIGNPLNDGEWTYTWQNGRQLAGMSKAGMNVAFKYNANGLRTRKIVNGVVTNYTLHGKTVVHMTRGNDELHFFYDAQNRPAVVVYNGTAYAYVKNLQGDIIAILDSAGSAVVRYTYDAWGMPTSIGGNMATTLGEINPFRYRGYVYDQETGLYYLRSRYYNSARCRFLNADDNLTSPHNLFRYCYPAPIQMVDPDGTEEFLEWLNSDEVVNRSFMLGCPLSFYGSLNLGNTAEVGSWASVRSGAMAYEANWTNSSYNTGYLTPTHNPVATLYRSISDAEYESIKTTGEFCLGGGAMEAKQFGLDYCETRRFGDWFNDSIIVSVQIDANTLHRTFDVRYHIDTTIFRHGVVTIHRDQLPDFNRLIYRNSIKFIQK